MLVFISGSINSGKTTTSKALAHKLGADFINVDDLNDTIPNFNLANDLDKSMDLAIKAINESLARGKDVVANYVVRQKDFDRFAGEIHTDRQFVITLAPRLEVAQSQRGDRVLTDWEVQRIKYHYDTGVASPNFGFVIDNSDLSLEETVQIILDKIQPIGLKRGTVRVEGYNPNWQKEFEAERQRLFETFGEKILEVEHIGSTSIPGLAAKPIIDMVVAVKSFDDLPEFIDELQKLGYEYMPERLFDNRKFFPKGSQENRTHHLNLVLQDDPEQWTKPIAFRDYLRTHGREREEYAKLKITLAQEYTNDRATYTKMKDDFFQSTINKSLS